MLHMHNQKLCHIELLHGSQFETTEQNTKQFLLISVSMFLSAECSIHANDILKMFLFAAQANYNSMREQLPMEKLQIGLHENILLDYSYSSYHSTKNRKKSSSLCLMFIHTTAHRQNLFSHFIFYSYFYR